MEEPVNILLLEDNLNDVELIHRQVVKSGIKFQWLHTSKLDAFKEALSTFNPDLILSDYHLVGFTGMDALVIVRHKYPQIPFIIVTGTLDEETAVETIKKGAWDYIVKERLLRLGTAIKNALLLKEEKKANALIREKLQISKERYMLSVEGSNDGIWDFNLKTNEAYYSLRWKSMLGYKENEIENNYKTWETLLHPNDKDYTLSVLDAHLKNKTAHYKSEFRLKCKNGNYKWVSARGKALFDKNGTPYRIAGSYTDISERKRSEEELRRYEHIVSNSNDMLALIDENYTFLAINNSFARAAGKPKDEIINYSVTEVFGQELFERVVKPNAEACMAGNIVRYQNWFDYRGIGRNFMDLVYSPYYDSFNNIKGYTVSGRNITALKQVEQELNKSKEMLSKAQSLGGIGSWELDIATNTINWSDEIYRIFHVDPKKIKATYDAFRENIYPDDREMVSKAYADSLASKKTYNIEYRLLLAGGVFKYVSETIETKYDSNDKPVQSIGLIQDITSRKQQELLLAARMRIIEYATDHSMHELIQKFLDEMELLTQSKIGFFHFVSSDEDIIELQAWSTNTQKYFCKVEGKKSHDPISKAGVWVDCVRERKTLIHNDYENLANKKGMPKGHAHIIRELVVPLFKDEKIVALMGIGNKAVDYNEKDVSMAEQLSASVWEIIHRKQAEQDLKKSEAELDALYNNAPLIMMLVNHKRQVVKMNTAALAMSRDARDKIIGSLVGETLKCVNATDSPKGCGFGPKCPNCDFRNTIIKTFETNKTYYRNEVKLSYKGSNGLEDLHLLLSTSHVSALSNKLVLVCLEDITQRKHAEEALKRSEELLTETGRIAKIGGWELDIPTMTTNATEETYRIFGRSLSLPPLTIDESIKHYDSEYQRFMQECVREAVEHGKNFDVEAPFVNETGKHIWLRTIGKVQRDGNKVVRLFGSMQDITERKKIEEELIKHRDNLENIVNERTEKLERTNIQLLAERDKAQRYLDIAEVILLALDTKMNVTLINKKGCQVLGYTEAEIIGKNWYDYFRDKTDNQEGAEEFSRLITRKGMNVNYYENYILRKNGERRLIAWHDINILDTDGNVIGMLSSGEDITERKKLETDLLKAKKIADKANKAKSIFLANMSHEIRTPMNAIIGFSEILGKMVHDNTQKSYLDSIKSSGKTLLNIINDVLDISKIEAGKIEIRKEAVSLKVLIEEMENMFSLRITEKGLSFKKIIDKSIPDYIESDELRLRQVLINLLSNAIKFTDTGAITIELKALNQSKNLIDLIISVKDTGIGISEKDQKKIFESFQQTEEQDSRKYGGTGLGLSISKRIIELLNGKITVSSNINNGSSFTIELANVKIPKKSNVYEDDKHKFKPEKLIFKKASILVVDDVKENRDIVKGYLVGYDILCAEATNGKQALDKAVELLPDLILMDLRMPIMDGYEATKRLKSKNTTSHIPIVALTASAYIKSAEEFALKGFDGYIRKPMHIIELVNEICKFIEFEEVESAKPVNNENAIDISENLTAKLPAIIEGLEVIKNESWVNLEKRQTLKGVQAFKNQLIDFNKEFELQFLNEYISKITDALTSFDIENIKALVLEFPNIIKLLKTRI